MEEDNLLKVISSSDLRVINSLDFPSYINRMAVLIPDYWSTDKFHVALGKIKKDPFTLKGILYVRTIEPSLKFDGVGFAIENSSYKHLLMDTMSRLFIPTTESVEGIIRGLYNEKYVRAQIPTTGHLPFAKP